MGKEMERNAEVFRLEVKAFKETTLERANVLLRAVGSKVGEALVVGNQYGPGTPVDTGNARGHWFAVVGDGEPAGHDGDADMSANAGAAVAAMALISATLKLGDVISYVNDAPYIEKLNNGHSQQAPGGMTDSIVASWDQLVDAEAARLGFRAA